MLAGDRARAREKFANYANCCIFFFFNEDESVCLGGVREGRVCVGGLGGGAREFVLV